MIALALIASVTTASGDDYRDARRGMVDLIARRGVRDGAVLEAMRTFPRHELVPEDRRNDAYADRVDLGSALDGSSCGVTVGRRFVGS